MAAPQFLKCIDCVYALWPTHAVGFCTAHNVTTINARDQSGPCGWDAKSYAPKKEPTE